MIQIAITVKKTAICRNKRFLQRKPAQVLCKKCVLKNLAKFIGKHFFNKVAGIRRKF